MITEASHKKRQEAHSWLFHRSNIISSYPFNHISSNYPFRWRSVFQSLLAICLYMVLHLSRCNIFIYLFIYLTTPIASHTQLSIYLLTYTASLIPLFISSTLLHCITTFCFIRVFSRKSIVKKRFARLSTSSFKKIESLPGKRIVL